MPRLKRNCLFAIPFVYILILIRFSQHKEAAFSVILLVMVDKRIDYLSGLIESIKAMTGVEDCLVVFSHNINDPDINELIARKLESQQFQQIYFPYSLDKFPHSFPGPDPNDCPRDYRLELGTEPNCSNWMSPDKFGHYREAKFTTLKHHFWWMMNHLNQEILPSHPTFNGRIIFLEEDYLVAPDALYILQKLIKEKPTLCPYCDLEVLGADGAVLEDLQLDFDEVYAEFWLSGEHFRGMAVSKPQLSAILNCRKEFCNFDDYNYDFSLMRVNTACLAKPWRILRPKIPRVLHVGLCGFHRKLEKEEDGQFKHCHSESQKIAHFFAGNRQRLFPDRLALRIAPFWSEPPVPPLGYGGWGDERDRQLCLNFTSSFFSKWRFWT